MSVISRGFRRILNPLFSMPLEADINKKLHNAAVLNKDILHIEVKGEELMFPSVWLRDNCQCADCYHTSAQSRIIDWSKFDVDVKANVVKQQAGKVTVAWTDGHSSEFDISWLKQRSFAAQAQRKHNEFYKPRKTTWNGKDFLDILKRFDYTQLLQSDRHLHDWLRDLSVYGVALIHNVPSQENSVDRLAEKIGFIKKTHYGEKFVVENRPNTSNVAYLSSNLQVHTDLPYYEYCPGVNLLHCITQTSSEGGNNLLSDSHFVAHYMKLNHPEEYKNLCDTEVEWSDIGVEHGNEFHKLYRSPVICEDKRGDIIRINFSVPQRGTHFPTDVVNVKPWYSAHNLFLRLSHKFAASFKTNAGEILAFDNIRLLHGRSQYTDTSGNVRKLVGAYLDWDEIYSRLRCLKSKLDDSS